MADAPIVVNRHHFQSTAQLPQPWIYVGRGTPLGNPYLIKDHGEERCLRLYKKWLWKQLQARNERVLAELRQITASHHLVCSCKPRPCHADVVIEAWRWARSQGLLGEQRPASRETYEQAERAALQDPAFH